MHLHHLITVLTVVPCVPLAVKLMDTFMTKMNVLILLLAKGAHSQCLMSLVNNLAIYCLQVSDENKTSEHTDTDCICTCYSQL